MQEASRFSWQSLLGTVIGVDEVGRGCLAGPVCAAAVILDTSKEFSFYRDSKTLSPQRRETLSDHIQKNHRWSVAYATVEEISQYNILQASLLAMKRAVLGLGVWEGKVLVDGSQLIPRLEGFEQKTFIKGDQHLQPIAAASLVAKVARDQLMAELELQYPGYGFKKHKGYSTQEHKASIQKLGPCPIHRPTFAGVREYMTLLS